MYNSSDYYDIDEWRNDSPSNIETDPVNGQVTSQATPLYQQQRTCTWSMVDRTIRESLPPSPHPVNGQVTSQATTPIYQQQRTCTWSMVDETIRESLDPPSPQEPSSSTVNVTSLPTVRYLIKTELDQYHCIGEVTSRQYQRIFERATSKVMQGKATSVDRVRKLVADYVFLYNN